ncbi:hypothetical protein BN14_05987 [Rhizoctonia solani AG-1 IB]|uniref:Uncharacterized protein n=1 Tax=Thanatephorus cucumeris (strain AG1-IB / isolate 7/3/14) TaxID=1108050 RepID=M5BZ83_THACB|nr:hypothetical protein BN14_05987 [Rhizoctonia solani AG-1 IB]
MSEAVRSMIAEAIRRRKELEEQQEQGQQVIKQDDHKGSLPPANQLLGENEEPEPSQSHKTSSRRRRCSPSTDLDTPKERQQKYASFTEGECDRFSLRGSRRTLVMNFAKRYETNQANSGVRAYLASGAFKDHAMDDLVCNHALYKVDKAIIKDEDSRSILNTQMRNKLTALRNAIKEKLETAVENGHCLNQVIFDIMPKKIEVTIEHRQRWAWIICRSKSDDTSKFWKALDKFMSDAELTLTKQVPNKRDCDEIRTQMYATALENHEKNYPNQIPAREQVDAPSWQIMLECSLVKYHSF